MYRIWTETEKEEKTENTAFISTSVIQEILNFLRESILYSYMISYHEDMKGLKI